MNDYAFDLHRIFIGELPALFYLEIVLRTSVMFLFSLVLIRIMGKRSLGQLSAFDLVIIIALGSAVGDPMFYPDVPLLQAMVVVTVVVGSERALTAVTTRSRRAEVFVDSTPTVLIEGGAIDATALRREFISRHELYEALRLHDIDAIEDVALAVLEPSGQLSVRKASAGPAGHELWSLH